MDISVDDTATHLGIAVSGELDASNVDVFQQRVEAAMAGDATKPVSLDLSQLGFLDSSGISALLAVREARVEAGGELTVSAASDPVARVLELTGLSQAFGLT